jgi:3-oxoacyl-[acyl-carrier-protein] synthase III
MLGQVRKGQAEMSDAEYKANEFKNERVSQMLYANDGGNATFQMGVPEVANKVQQHVAEQKLMANGINPQIPFTSNRFAA